MAKQIALLRAVNVGKRQVPMARLRELMGAAGFQDVSTYLQSGNVLFADGGNSPEQNGAKLEQLLVEDGLGLVGYRVLNAQVGRKIDRERMR